MRGPNSRFRWIPWSYFVEVNLHNMNVLMGVILTYSHILKRWCQETTRSSTTESNDFSWRTQTVQTEPMSTTRGFSLIRWLLRSTDFLVSLISWVAIFYQFVGSHDFMGCNVLLICGFSQFHGVQCFTDNTQLTEVFSGDVLEFGTEVGGIWIGKCTNHDWEV